MIAKLMSWYRLIALMILLFGCALSVLLMMVGRSEQGMAFAIASFLFSAAPLLDYIGRAREEQGWKTTAMLMLAGWLVLTGWLLAKAPDGQPREGARVQNRYFNDGWRYPRATPGNLVPEIDQLLLGLKLAAMFDPLLTRDQTDRVAALTTEIYGQLEADEDFRALGSVLQHGYDDLLTDRTNHGHAFLYIPKNLDRKQPAPLLVFLHGSGGNLKAYTWLLSQIADELGMVVLAPTFGMGSWEEPGTSRTLRAAIDDANSVVRLDPLRQHLMGLSNGALGVCQAGAGLGAQFRSLILISPVLDERVIESVEFLEHSKDRRVLVLTGEKDNRVPIDDLMPILDQIRRARSRLTVETVADGDHFMLFTHREQVLQRIAEWVSVSAEP